MKLEKLIDGLDIILSHGNLDIEIDKVVYNSRQATEGSVFVAIEGYTIDGHNFIKDAIEQGAKAIIIQKDIYMEEGITYIKVYDTRLALAKVSSNIYNEPSKKLDLIGVTGTNAKTTITYLVKSIFEANQRKIGVVGTIGNVINGEMIKTNNTTPESLDLQGTFDSMVKSGLDSCIMEVSSHALELKRVEYSDFKVGIFTNLTVDHLDYHKTLENYFNAKKKLFHKTSEYNIINRDDTYGRKIIEEVKDLKPSLLTYGLDNRADIYATNINYSPIGTRFELNTPRGKVDLFIKIPGVFSVYNALAAAACGYSFGIGLETIKSGLESIEGVKGRFEIVPTNRDFTVIIDFAHTADALEKVLNTVNQFAEGRKVIVFGAGGDRDRSKRAPMGEAAGKNCDLSIVTSDNPRTEDPMAIINDVIEGVKAVGGNYISIVDRKEAIRYAIKNAQPKDIILLTGKGHENYTVIGKEVLPFNERDIVIEALEEMH